MSTQNQVFALLDGFYCIVDGRTFGPWPMIEYARAGLQVEQRRAQCRMIRAVELATYRNGERRIPRSK